MAKIWQIPECFFSLSVFHQGEEGTSWYIILKGSVNVVIYGKVGDYSPYNDPLILTFVGLLVTDQRAALRRVLSAHSMKETTLGSWRWSMTPPELLPLSFERTTVIS